MYNDNSQTVTLDVLDLESPISFPSSTGGNKATIKKMIVADPGLGVLINFEAAPGTNYNEIRLHFELGRMEEGIFTVHHSAEFSTRIDAESNISFPRDLIFVTPFVDSNFLEEPQEGLYFTLSVTYIKEGESSSSVTFHTDSPELVEMLEKDKTFKYELLGPTGMAMSNNSDPIEYTDVLFHTAGTAWCTEFPNPNTDYKSVKTTVTQYSNGMNMGEHIFEAISGSINTNTNAISWIPAIESLSAHTSRQLFSIIITQNPHTTLSVPPYPEDPELFSYPTEDVIIQLVSSFEL